MKQHHWQILTWVLKGSLKRAFNCNFLAMSLIIGVGFLFVAQKSLADLPVIDPAEIAQVVEVLHEAEKQYETLKYQYNQLKTQYASITGNYGWGSFDNSLSQLNDQREFSASNWQSALQGMAGGNPARYQQLLAQYKAAHQTMTTSDYAKGADKNLSLDYQNQVQTNEASATISTYEFNDINQHLKTLYTLGQQIENAKQNRDLKSAVDLNSRIQLQIGYISMEELRMQAILNQQVAQIQSHQISVESEASQFNQAGENPS